MLFVGVERLKYAKSIDDEAQQSSQNRARIKEQALQIEDLKKLIAASESKAEAMKTELNELRSKAAGVQRKVKQTIVKHLF